MSGIDASHNFTECKVQLLAFQDTHVEPQLPFQEKIVWPFSFYILVKEGSLADVRGRIISILGEPSSRWSIRQSISDTIGFVYFERQDDAFWFRIAF
jgi:hypothetical protein